MTTLINNLDQMNAYAESCLETSYPSIKFDDLKDCANGPLGNQLLYAAGLLTNNLVPRLNYVPWINNNKVHSSDIQNGAEKNLIEFVCLNYKVKKAF